MPQVFVKTHRIGGSDDTINAHVNGKLRQFLDGKERKELGTPGRERGGKEVRRGAEEWRKKRTRKKRVVKIFCILFFLFSYFFLVCIETHNLKQYGIMNEEERSRPYSRARRRTSLSVATTSRARDTSVVLIRREPPRSSACGRNNAASRSFGRQRRGRV